MNCLQNVGMLGIEPVEHQGQKIIPIEFLKTLLPDPASLGPRTVGKQILDVLLKELKMENQEKFISTMFVIIKSAIEKLEHKLFLIQQEFQQ